MTPAERAGDVAARAQADAAARRKAAATWAFDEVYPVLVPTAAATTGWTCPNGHVTVNTLTSRAGRVYGMCVTCHAFEGPQAASPEDGDTVTVDEYCALLSEEDAAAYRKGIAGLARAEEEHDAYMRAKPPRSRPASPRPMTDDEYCAMYRFTEAEAEQWRKDRAWIARRAREADELFKRRLILAIIVILLIIIFVLPSPTVQHWLNAPPDCYDRSCFGGGA
jgi:hypothetical protein